MLGPPPAGVQQPFPAQQVPPLPAVVPQTAGSAAGQVQMPDAQLAPLAQAVPHAPQFEGSVRTLTHAPPQASSPEGQQTPEVQVSPVGQALPQAPQFASSVVRYAHAVAQAVAPEGHRQTWATHSSFASGHAYPQAPQFEGSVRVFAQTAPQSV